MIRTVLTLTALLSAGSAHAADLVVRVTGIGDAVGTIRVAACTEAEFLRTCRLTGSAPARPGSIDITIRGVPSGRYAVQVFHDRDGDAKLKSSLIGMPAEPFGLSRSPGMSFGPPEFADAAIDIDGQKAIVPVALRS